MKVLVTGGAGFIGSNTVDLLLARGHDVVIMDALMSPVHPEPPTKPDYVPKDVAFHQADVRSSDAWEKALPSVDAVLHLAAYMDYFQDFSKFFHVNTVSTALMYETIVRKKLPVRKIVLASSQAVYGEGPYECPQHGRQWPGLRTAALLKRGEWDLRCDVCGVPLTPVVADESRVNPNNSYAVSKYALELTAQTLGSRYDIPTVCMRYSIVQGPRQSFTNAYSGLLRIFVQRLLSGKPPSCYEDGNQLRDYVHVKDVARANVLALEDTRAQGVYNVGGMAPIRVRDYALRLCARLDGSFQPQIPGLFRFGDTRHIFSDAQRLRALGWEPTADLDQIIEDYVAWVRTATGLRDYYEDAERRMHGLGILQAADGAI